MPECTLCNSESFDVVDGLYFCTDCGTQSQDVREEVNEIDDAAAFNVRRSVKKTKERKKKVHECGKPWFSLEGYQILIKAQVEFLMRIGVDPAIKDVVGQMWFKFVEQSTNAFGTRGDESLGRSNRDNIMDFTLTDSIPRKTPKHFRKEQETDDALELSSEIAREDFYDDDDPTGALFEEDAGSHVGSVKVVCHKTKSRTDVKRMTMQHTLAFCFLGILWLKEPICLSDLIRWAVEGHLPYFNATAYFPSHMKLSENDIFMFTRSVVPSKYNLSSLAKRLSKYISLPDVPRHPINIYIARHAIDLQFPACLHRYVGAVVKMIELNMTSLDRILNYDDLAMAYIIISLRLIYGLDDATEHKLGELASEAELQLFPTWSDLLETIHFSDCHRLEHGIPWNKEDLHQIKDAHNYGKYCQEKVFGSWKPEATVHRYTRTYRGIQGLDAGKQKEYGDMFSLLLKNQDVDNTEHVSSFQLSNNIHRKAERKECKKTLSVDTLSSFYAIKATDDELRDSRNCYIRYEFPRCRKRQQGQECVRRNYWNNAILPKSLRQLVEVCSKLVYCEPAVLYNVVQMLENKMFEEA